jgi:hypothetical protein
MSDVLGALRFERGVEAVTEDDQGGVLAFGGRAIELGIDGDAGFCGNSEAMTNVVRVG